MSASNATMTVIPGEREAFSAPALAGEVPTEASAEVGEGGMHRTRPLRFARKCSLSTSPWLRLTASPRQVNRTWPAVALAKAAAARGRKGSLAGHDKKSIIQPSPLQLSCLP